MSKIVELNTSDLTLVAGGSIVREIEEAYPGGVWIGNSYFPSGVPEAPWTGPVVTGF